MVLNELFEYKKKDGQAHIFTGIKVGF